MSHKPDYEKLERKILELEKAKNEYARVEEELQYRLRFEELITDISTKFINLPLLEIDQGLNDALKAIGEFADVDRSYMFRYNDKRTGMESIHSWCAPNIDSHIERLGKVPFKVFSWLLRKINHSEVVHIPRLDYLPPEASDVKKDLELQGILSMIMVPTVSGGSVVGFLGFDSVKKHKTWSPDIIALLKIVGEIFASALDRKKAEETRRATEGKYQNILETIEDGYWEVDLEGKFIFFNDAFCRISRTPRELLMGINPGEFTSPGESKRLYETFVNVFQTGEPAKIDSYELMRGDGNPAYFEMSVSLIRDHTGRPVGFRGISRDVTERMRTEAALRESEARYRAVLKAHPDPVVISDIDGRVIYLNPAFEETFGWSLEERRGKDMEDLVPQDDAKQNNKILEKLMAGESFSGIETQRYAKSGEIIPVSISGAVYRDAENNPIGRVITIRDIREKKRMEAQLLSAQKIESIGTLAGGIAHDFNNLLTSIQGNVSLALFDMNDQHPLYESMKNIEKSVQSGAKLTHQLLGYARKGRYEIKPLDLNRLLKDMSETFGRTRKEIVINHHLTSDLLTVEADQGQMEQVMLNLFVNAYQAMPDGGELFITTKNVRQDDFRERIYNPNPGEYVLIQIMDTGTGMSKETISHIFEPFFTTKEMGRGTGLGLASTYGIIKGHRGYIDVDSEEGKGTTFKLYLPGTREKTEKSSEPKGKVVGGKETILLVDDEVGVLKIAAKILRRLNYTVLEAGNGKEALKIYEKNKEQIDLVILDMIMPYMGGSETFDRIKGINPNAKVLLSSGYSVDGQAQDILNRGCNGFMQKPFTLANLSTKVTEILNS